ncbi:MAG: 2OG-Fe(II) oxygenase [Magnetovibrio sp.]|nr:2OG-Fe(II) oxygenase [Magnetovibrio sp.]
MSVGKPGQFYAVIEAAFSAEECTRLVDVFDSLEAADGGLVAGGFDHTVRQSSLVWVPETKDLAWVEDRFAKVVAEANRTVFGFALDGFEEQFQIAAYGPGHYYDWHIDQGQGFAASRRKLTISVQLTSPDQYAGGALEINANGSPFALPKVQGTAVVFASNTLHRVAPVTSGLRHSLVVWMHGPPFR